MLSKVKIKWIHSLDIKKIRNELRLFVAEGQKLVLELMPLLSCRFLAATPDWLDKHPGIKATEIAEVSMQDLIKAGKQQSPQEVLAVFEMPNRDLDLNELSTDLSLALDNIQDPGNLGTIIRTADWFGINTILCSFGCVDAYNPKTVQASMGSIARVAVHYQDLEKILPEIGVPIFGTFLEGKSLFHFQHLPQAAIVLLGNEGKGISDKLRLLVNEKIYIPEYPFGNKRVESLNVSIATGIICAAFRNQHQLIAPQY